MQKPHPSIRLVVFSICRKVETNVALGRTPVYKKKTFGVKEKEKKRREKEMRKHHRQRRQGHRIPVETTCDRWLLR